MSCLSVATFIHFQHTPEFIWLRQVNRRDVGGWWRGSLWVVEWMKHNFYIKLCFLFSIIFLFASTYFYFILLTAESLPIPAKWRFTLWTYEDDQPNNHYNIFIDLCFASCCTSLQVFIYIYIIYKPMCGMAYTTIY